MKLLYVISFYPLLLLIKAVLGSFARRSAVADTEILRLVA